MSYSKWVFGPGVVILTILSANLQAVADKFRASKPQCLEKCGKVTIPYPFGIGDDCSYDPSFTITCKQTSDRPFRTPFSGNREVLSISLDQGNIRMPSHVVRNCYSRSSGQLLSGANTTAGSLEESNFTVNSTQNYFAATGCDALATFSSHRILTSNVSFFYNVSYTYGCKSQCNSSKEVNDSEENCSGVGCCQVPVPWRIQNLTMDARSQSNYTNSSKEFTPCSSTFVVAKDSFNFTLANLTMSIDHMPTALPVVYDWTIGNETCEEARANNKCLCSKSHRSECTDDYNYIPQGYSCHCLPGYSGNPYLPNGCRDIDECHSGDNDCKHPASCENTEGSYRCKCPNGYTGSGTTRDPCIMIKNNSIKIILGLSISLGATLLLLGGPWLNAVIKKRKANKQRAKHFEQNGGMLLRQQVSSDDTVIERLKIFTVDELEEATNHFSTGRILGHGGQGTVYKGMLSGGRIVAIKKSKKVDENQRGDFINEVVILSQINHRNIVKLLGCCLETEVPLLVYEFIPNGTLFYHLHYPSEEFPITWKMRLQIANDAASALAYLHSASSIPIFHRDIKSSNILLDDKYRAKLSDFGTSRSVAIDQTHITTSVRGTFGYVDPEYLQSSQFTEKSDVYSFGVVLIELLTGEKAIRATSREDKSLISWFLSHMEESCLFVDSQVLQEGSKEELLVVANLAQRCLNLDGKQRPTMQQVLTEIEAVRSLHTAQTNQQGRPKTEPVLIKRTQSILQGISSSNSLTSRLERCSVDSAELSLLFNPR